LKQQGGDFLKFNLHLPTDGNTNQYTSVSPKLARKLDNIQVLNASDAANFGKIKLFPKKNGQVSSSLEKIRTKGFNHSPVYGL
jgi:hypothetical protein